MSNKRIHIINAHQKWNGVAEGTLTQHYIDTMTKVLKDEKVSYTITNIDNGYDVEQEIAALVAADLVILQFPMYWMGLPWLGKKYIDEVFMAGQGRVYQNDGRDINDASKKYGSGGLLTANYMLSITCNAPVEAFTNEGQFFHAHGVDNAFMAVHKSLQFVGMKQLPTFSSHDIFKNPQIAADTQRLEQMLTGYCRNE